MEPRRKKPKLHEETNHNIYFPEKTHPTCFPPFLISAMSKQPPPCALRMACPAQESHLYVEPLLVAYMSTQPLKAFGHRLLSMYYVLVLYLDMASLFWLLAQPPSLSTNLGHAQDLVPGTGRLLDVEAVGQQRTVDEIPRLREADDCRLAFLDRNWW